MIALLIGILIYFLASGFTTSNKAIKAANIEIAVIVNKENPVTASSASEIKAYYLREKTRRWPVINKNIRPVANKNNNAEQTTFYQKVLNMRADDVEKYFISRQYQSAEKPQDKFSSDKEIIDFVGNEIGAIGFVNAASLNAEARSKVKVLLTVN